MGLAISTGVLHLYATISDEDGDGICDELEILGCTYIQADNYNPEATEDDGTCVDETFDIVGCTEPSACNYLDIATLDDGSCEFAECGYDCDGVCLEDTDGDGICDLFDLECEGDGYCGSAPCGMRTSKCVCRFPFVKATSTTTA